LRAQVVQSIAKVQWTADNCVNTCLIVVVVDWMSTSRGIATARLAWIMLAIRIINAIYSKRYDIACYKLPVVLVVVVGIDVAAVADVVAVVTGVTVVFGCVFGCVFGFDD